jgi:hypothetical protein
MSRTEMTLRHSREELREQRRPGDERASVHALISFISTLAGRRSQLVTRQLSMHLSLS